MRISCLSLDDFCTNIEGATVYRETVHVHKSVRPVNKEGTSSDVIFQASAILVYGADEQALLECGVRCGINRGTKDGGPEGSDNWDKLFAQLQRYADTKGLQIKPGILDF